MIIEAIGRRLRLAVIGGRPGSVIGEVHRAGARLDGYYELWLPLFPLTLSDLGGTAAPSGFPMNATIHHGAS